MASAAPTTMAVSPPNVWARREPLVELWDGAADLETELRMLVGVEEMPEDGFEDTDPEDEMVPDGTTVVGVTTTEVMVTETDPLGTTTIVVIGAVVVGAVSVVEVSVVEVSVVEVSVVKVGDAVEGVAEMKDDDAVMEVVAGVEEGDADDDDEFPAIASWIVNLGLLFPLFPNKTIM